MAVKKKASKPKAKPAPKAKAKKVLKATTAIKASAVKSAKKAAKGAKIKKVSGYEPAKAKPSARLVLYGLQPSTPSGKVALMLAMLGEPYDYRHVDLPGGAHKTPDYAKINRFQQVPALVDGEEVVVQSNVILQYLAEKFGKFGGKTPAERRRIAEWLAWDLDKLTTLGQVRFIRRFMKQPDHPALAFVEARARASLEFLDRHLGTSKFVAGMHPTIADIAIFGWIAVAEEAGFDPAHFPNLRDWALRMLKLPGVAHPYALLPTEDKVSA
ncbi:MAG: glutathione S-transferase family protein [Alphaproteobacteria bacterium]|nr:glutathione S-transferase family protein [Alphaproteobacteria bacterium]MBN9497099.1 glutathione S-transferase family protein [Alphaproteobacteria bacterium]